MEAVAGEAFGALFDAGHFAAGLARAGVDAAGMDEAALRALLLERGARLRVSPSPFFDEEHYLDRHPDIRGAGLWGFEHFLTAGIDEGRQPHPLVDVAFIAADRGVGLAEALRTWLAHESAPNEIVWHAYARWQEAPRLRQQRAIWRGLARHCAGDRGLAARVLTYLPLLVEPRLASGTAAWSLVERALGEGAYDVLPSPFLRVPLARRPDAGSGPAPLLERLPADPDRRWSPTPWLDMGFYEVRNADLGVWTRELLLHFLRHGQFEGRESHPMFDPAWYREQYGLGRGEPIHPHYVASALRGYPVRSNAACMAPVDYAIMAGVDVETAIDGIATAFSTLFAISAPLADAGRLSADDVAVGEQIAAAAALDPAIRPNRPTRVLMPKPLDIGHAAPLERISRMLTGCEIVLFRDHISLGGADRVAGLMARALIGNGYTVGVVATARTPDHDIGAARYGSATIVVMEDLLHRRDELLEGELAYEIATLPDTRAAIAVNSAVALETFGRFGRQIAAWAPMFVTYFCDDLDEHGNPDGYPARSFLSLAGRLAGVFTDTIHLRDELRARVAPSVALAASVRALPTPHPGRTAPEGDDAEQGAPAVDPVGEPARVVWAGRLDRQKRVDLLPPIRRLMPGVEIDVWGKAVLDRSPFEGVEDHGLNLMGTYDEFSEVLARRPTAFLYTAAWDGAPTVLLDVVAARLPIVASDVGGVRECLPDGYPHLVPPGEGPDAYAAALRRLLADLKDRGRDAVTAGFADVIAARSTGAFERVLVGAMHRAGVRPSRRDGGAGS